MDFFRMGHRIRNLRSIHHLSQADLAEIIDVSTNYIGQIERGDRKPSLETLVSLCNALHTSMDYILSDSIDLDEDQVTLDILAKLNTLSLKEKQFFYNTLMNYIHLKEGTDDASST